MQKRAIAITLAVLALGLYAPKAMATTQQAADNGCFIATTPTSVLLLDEDGLPYADIGPVLGSGPGITSGAEGHLITTRQNSTHLLIYDLTADATSCDYNAGQVGDRGLVAETYAYSTHQAATFVSKVALDCTDYVAIDMGRTGFLGITRTATHIWVLNKLDGGVASINIATEAVVHYPNIGLTVTEQPYAMLYDDNGTFYYSGTHAYSSGNPPNSTNISVWQFLPLPIDDMDINSSYVVASSAGNGDEVYFIPISNPGSFMTRMLTDSRGIAISQNNIVMAIGGGAPDIGLWRYDGNNAFTKDSQAVTTEEVWTIKYMSPQPICGDGIKNGTELCDGSDLNNQDCTNHSFVGGPLACDAFCAFDTAGCHMCGNNTIDGTELCDGPAFGSATCESLNFDYGTLTCTGSCTIDTSGCHYFICGDDIMNGTDECDNLDFGTQTCSDFGHAFGDLTCNSDCTVDTSGCFDASCGDGILNQASEMCDASDLGTNTCESLNFDGGTLACDASCQLDASQCYRCGDGIINGPNEECDMQAFGNATCQNQGYDDGDLACDQSCGFDTSGCTLNCGNGTIDDGEECDDGNLADSDGCSSSCETESNVCGNGIVDDGEQCDGAALNNNTCADHDFDDGTLTCSNQCQFDTTNCTKEPKSGCGCSSNQDSGPTGPLFLIIGCIGLLLLRRRKSQ
ncbi:DUF4215 domain-containing protein [Patescibacteria group bacterium]